jgi:hypothetical protein
MGQHNEDVLCGELCLSPAELAALEKVGMIGTRPIFP